jgi:hypothetical protein
MIFLIAICFGLIISAPKNCCAQEKTKDELKAEREELRSEMKSKEALDRRAKIEKLSEPKPSGIGSVDELASNSTKILNSNKEFNQLVPEMYKRTIGESVDGVTDVTVKKPTAEELAQLAMNINSQIKAVADASSSLNNASDDLSKASPLKAPKATKSLNYSKDVLALTGPELQLHLKVINNLIATLSSSGNY